MKNDNRNINSDDSKLEDCLKDNKYWTNCPNIDSEENENNYMDNKVVQCDKCYILTSISEFDGKMICGCQGNNKLITHDLIKKMPNKQNDNDLTMKQLFEEMKQIKKILENINLKINENKFSIDI